MNFSDILAPAQPKSGRRPADCILAGAEALDYRLLADVDAVDIRLGAQRANRANDEDSRGWIEACLCVAQFHKRRMAVRLAVQPLASS